MAEISSEGGEERVVPPDGTVRLAVEHIGGIDACEVEFRPGATVLVGRNATNRTSLLTALRDVLGGAPAAVKTHADDASIELEFGEETFERTYRREHGRLTSDGTECADERALIDHFVSLLGDNAVRLAIERGEDLRDLILEPVDTAAIEEEITSLASQRESLQRRLEDIRNERERLPALEERRRAQENRLEEIGTELEPIRETLDGHTPPEDGETPEDALVEQLREKREELVEARDRIENQESTLAECRERETDLERELSDVSVPTQEIETLEERLEGLQREKRALDDRVVDLQQVLRFNREMVSGEDGIFAEESDADVTASLDPSRQQVECWTCGHTVDQGDIRERLEDLETALEEWKGERRGLETEIGELEQQLVERRSVEERRASLEDALETTREEIDIRERKIEHLEAREAELEATVQDIETRAADEGEDNDELIAAYRRQSELEYERGKVEQALSEVEGEIAELEALGEEAEEIVAEVDETEDRLATLRSRIEDIERDVVSAFNAQMEELLALLDFDNLARVWIELKLAGSDRAFELHIVREDPDGTGYEDTIDTLSESEREVIGLVVGLAGYLALDAHEAAPFLLLDSLEAIDADRIETLVAHFASHVPYLIIALLPEDAHELSDSYRRIPARQLKAKTS